MKTETPCTNCSTAFVVETVTRIEREAMAVLGACCPACCTIAATYYRSDAYQAFDEVEE